MQTLQGRHYATAEPITVTWDAERISGVQRDDPAPDLPWIAPALWDLQVNGYRGRDLSEGEHLAHIAEDLSRAGIARFFPTVITGSPEDMTRRLGVLRAAIASSPQLSRSVPGLHLEGPYLSAQDGPRGAHPLAHIRPPSWEHFRRLQEAAGGRIRILTLAPEWPDAPRFIERVVASGVMVSIGHTAADTHAIADAVTAGARLSTHLGNGLAMTIDRHRNPLWPQLADDRLVATFIADGEHLPPEMLRAMMSAKGRERCVFVSDSVAQAGLPPGSYTGVGGQQVEVLPSGRVQIPGTPMLAGSGKNLLQCVVQASQSGVCPLDAALDMASVHPAAILGTDLGLHQGAVADLIAFRVEPGGTIRVKATVRGGEWLFRSRT